MPRFFKENFNENTQITGEDGRHISRSLRMKVGEKLTVCDTFGTDYICEITEILDTDVSLKILETKKSDTEPNINVTLFQCIPKGDKFDTVVQKSVELGVNTIVPVLSEHCVSRPDQKSMQKKCARMQKIAIEAAKQSGRGILPKIENMINFNAFLNRIKDFDAVILFYELGGKPIREIITDEIKNLAIIIGPEGGFAKSEVEKAIDSGAIAATLGKRILRTETAPLAALTSVMLLSGNLE